MPQQLDIYLQGGESEVALQQRDVYIKGGLDDVVVGGLTGTEDSLAYRIAEIARHFHGPERWFGKSADQSEDDWAADTLTPFRAISGDGDYGADANDEAKVLGEDDTPVQAGRVYFDMHRVLVVGVSVNTEYKLRFIWGTGTMAAAITAGQYTEVLVKFDATNPQQSAGIPFDLRIRRLAAGTQVWCQAKNATDNATIDFYIGLHEYEG